MLKYNLDTRSALYKLLNNINSYVINYNYSDY